MKILFYCSLMVIFVHLGFSQNTLIPEFNSNVITQEFDRALVQSDTLTLKSLIHPEITMGHSNGWIQDETNLIETLGSGYVDYEFIKMLEQPVITYSSSHITVTRRDIDVVGKVHDTKFEVKLQVLETWIYEDSNWKLLARQSVNRKEN